MVKENKKYATAGLVVGALVLTFFLANYAVPRALVMFTKASVATQVSIKDSYVLGQKVLAKADGSDSCVVNVFILDKNSKGVPGKGVQLNGMEGIEPASSVTDNDGKASFTVKSNTEGQFKLTGNIGGVDIPQGVSVTFRN